MRRQDLDEHRKWRASFLLSSFTSVAPWGMGAATTMYPFVPMRSESTRISPVKNDRIMDAFARLAAPSPFPITRRYDIAQLPLTNAEAAHHMNVMQGYEVATDVSRAQLQHAISAAKNTGGLIGYLYLANKLNDYAVARSLEKKKWAVSNRVIRQARLDTHLKLIPKKADAQIAGWKRAWGRQQDDEDEDDEATDHHHINRPSIRGRNKRTSAPTNKKKKKEDKKKTGDLLGMLQKLAI